MDLKVDIELSQRFRLSRRKLVTLGVATVTLAPSAFLVRGCSIPGLSSFQEIRTVRGEWRTLPLPDGSSAMLSPGSRMSIDYDRHRRAISLHAGKAFFRIAKDVLRPFVVQGMYGRVRVVHAAACAVTQELHQTVITGVEGLITASRIEDQNEQEAIDLGPGRQICFSPGALSRPSDVDLAKELAWTDRKIYFESVTVEEAINQMNLANQAQLTLPSHPRVGVQRISGIFELDNPEKFRRYLERALEGTGAKHP